MHNIIITHRYNGDLFDTMLSPTIKLLQSKCISISPKNDEDITYKSIMYNTGVKTALDNKLINDNTIVIFTSPNVNIIDPLFMEKLDYIFNSNSTCDNVGVVGVTGFSDINNFGNINNLLNGITCISPDDKYIGSENRAFHRNVSNVNDSIFAVRGKVLLNLAPFNTKTNMGVGVEICINAYKCGYTATIADIAIRLDKFPTISYNDIVPILNYYNWDGDMNKIHNTNTLLPIDVEI